LLAKYQADLTKDEAAMCIFSLVGEPAWSQGKVHRLDAGIR
jgi:hypothetical protein